MNSPFFRDLYSIYSIWELLGPHSHLNPFPLGFHPHHGTETFSSRAPMTSKLPGLMDPFPAVSNSASEQPWTIEPLHLEALPFQVSMTIEPPVFLGHSFSLPQLLPYPTSKCQHPLEVGRGPAPLPSLSLLSLWVILNISMATNTMHRL